MSKGHVSVVGLGKLGVCMAACLASKGFAVFGVDLNPHLVDLTNRGKAFVLEPGLEALVRSHTHNFKASMSIAQAVEATTMTFIVVPTPSEPDGRLSTRHVKQAAREIGQALAHKNTYHTVVLVSTVLPGGTREAVVDTLEKESGKRCSVDFGVCYNPEFVALGNVIRDLLNPELILIGESDPRAGETLLRLYSGFVDSCPVTTRCNFENAELAKLAVNSFVTMKISFANFLAELCERFQGGDVDIVTKAVGSDSRIGPLFLRGGLGFGGPCLPRDAVAFSVLAQSLGVSAEMVDAVGRYNRSIAGRVVKMVQDHLPAGGAAFVIGLAYKSGTPVVEESQGLEIARTLADGGAQVLVYDPLAGEEARLHLRDSVRYTSSLAEGVGSADVIVLANALSELRELPGAIAANRHKALVVIDCWRSLPELKSIGGVRYLGLGSSISNAQMAMVAP